MPFSQNQIVCIADWQNQLPSLLFAEVVQHVLPRQHYWVRPLVLATAQSAQSRIETIGDKDWIWQDLRQGSDLLLPEELFRAALDTEVLPLMSLLYQAEVKIGPEAQEDPGPIARQKIHAFVTQVCRSRPEAFAAKTGRG
jgi:hypothetical protein